MQGKMLEWLKRHAWKACSRQNWHGGSNPPLSANVFLILKDMNNLIAKIAIITFLAFSQSLTAPAQGGRTAVSGEAKAPQATVVAAGDS